jgi:hypothetical protein
MSPLPSKNAFEIFSRLLVNNATALSGLDSRVTRNSYSISLAKDWNAWLTSQIHFLSSDKELVAISHGDSLTQYLSIQDP